MKSNSISESDSSRRRTPLARKCLATSWVFSLLSLTVLYNFAPAQSPDASPERLAAPSPGNAATSGQPTTVFEDDFEQGIDRWVILDPETWKVFEHESNGSTNHVLGITNQQSDYQAPHRSPFHVALVKDLEVGDCEISFRVRSTKDSGAHRDCCVFFGYQDDRHFYYVHVGAKPDAVSGQILIVNDAPRTAITNNQTKVPWTDDWHNVRLIRRIKAGSIDVFFDDMKTPWLSVNDKTFGKGRVGIGSFDDMDEFDDVQVRSL